MGRQFIRLVALTGIRLLEIALAGMWLLPQDPVMGGERPPATARETVVPGNRGIAARYSGDRGIAKDPAVIFADDFESWTENGTQPPPGAGWSVRKNNVSRTHVVPGNVATGGTPGPGAGVLEIACWSQGSGSQAGGLSRKLGNYNHANERLGDGYDEIYVRYYLKFDENYRGVQNHGANLGGRDVTRPDSAWVGMAAVRDVSSRGYFYSGLQPYGKLGSREVEMGFYSYHLDKKDQWGETYYHGLPKEFDAAHPIKVYFDNLVMARRYVGPIQNQGR